MKPLVFNVWKIRFILELFWFKIKSVKQEFTVLYIGIDSIPDMLLFWFTFVVCNYGFDLTVTNCPRGGMADAADLKSAEDKTHTGSSPVGGNIKDNV